MDYAGRRLLTPAQRLEAGREELVFLAGRLANEMRRSLSMGDASLRSLLPRLRSASPDVAARGQALTGLARRLALASGRAQHDREARTETARAALGHLDPARVLARGYAIARRADGSLVRSGAGLTTGEALDLAFAQGGARVTVDEPR